MPDDVFPAIIRENARWSDLVAGTHGLTGLWTPMAWTSPTRTPPLYADAVTLAPDVGPAAVLDRIDTTTPGASVKDSFATLDLGAGWTVLFEATWLLHTDATASVAAEPWTVVGPDRFDAWLTAWGGPSDVLLPGLLDEPSVAVVAHWNGDTVTAGAILHHGAGVIGVSNLFLVAEADSTHAWAGCVAAAARRWPGRPLVGYESGDDLTDALERGSTPLGLLRVWLLDDRAS